MGIKRRHRSHLCVRFGVTIASLFVAGRIAVAQDTPPAAPPVIDPSDKAEAGAATRILTGTVIDTTGAPVADIGVSITAFRPARAPTATQPGSGPAIRNLSTNTDSEGRFTVPKIALDELVFVDVRSMDCRYVSGGEVAVADGGLHAALRIARLSARIFGRVVDARGKPVAAAEVWSDEGGMVASAITDASGVFTLKHLPQGHVKIGIAKGKLWSEQSAESMAVPGGGNTSAGVNVAVSAKPVTITFRASVPAAPDDAAIRASLLSRMIAAKNGSARVDRSDLANYLAENDLDAALRLAATVHKPGEALADGVIANFIEARLKADPKAAAAWALPRVALMGQAMTRIRSDCEIGIALSYTDAAAAERWYASCRADSEQPKAAVDLNRARLVALAALLHKSDDEAAHLKRLATVLDTMPDGDYSRVRCAMQVARGDIPAAETLIEKATPPEKVEFYEEVVRQCLRYSPSLCRLYLGKLQAAAAPLADDRNQGWLRERAARLILSVIAVLGPTDPSGALAVAKTIPETDVAYPQALAAAARFQRPEIAGPLWAAASARADSNLKGTGSNDGDLQYRATTEMLSIASEAAKGPSAARAPALWTAALEAARNEDFGTSGDPAWAVEAARFDPGIARMLLEHTYADARDQPPGAVGRYMMLQTALAMTTIDAARAAELLDGVPPPTKLEEGMSGYDASEGRTGEIPDYIGDATRLEMIQLLALPPARRAAVTSKILSGSEIEDALGAP